jgi:hypothetical protein
MINDDHDCLTIIGIILSMIISINYQSYHASWLPCSPFISIHQNIYFVLKVIQHAKWVAQTGFETVKSEVLGKLGGMGTGAGQALGESNMALWEWSCSPLWFVSQKANSRTQP